MFLINIKIIWKIIFKYYYPIITPFNYSYNLLILDNLKNLFLIYITLHK